ncbi:helix-turn-helix transcriptional regulator [Spirabiliibacterium falconis]|uniref:helix-turn-helix transcriptional regulator n=1 Tax=Spirabiliibacterium falconis TaxID=572023 RepID=UPI001AADA080|nr:PAS domain-containing protein [Spirabiliibacterium falconis]MBE2895118.1 hypothetical protein [Spirabiliibacterium falconis]
MTSPNSIDFPILKTPLTRVDKLILQSYEPVLAMLKNFLGEQCEAVLHSLDDLHHSVINIVNPHLTGRRIGSPITNTALQMLKKMNEEHVFVTESYFTHTKSGQKMRSITQAIIGENERVIGLLCVNLNLDTSLNQFMSFLLTPNQSSKPMVEQAIEQEQFAESIDDLFTQTISKVLEDIHTRSDITANNKNKVIISRLYSQGLFELKGAVKIVATILNISQHTVYLHLRNQKSKEV